MLYNTRGLPKTAISRGGGSIATSVFGYSPAKRYACTKCNYTVKTWGYDGVCPKCSSPVVLAFAHQGVLNTLCCIFFLGRVDVRLGVSSRYGGAYRSSEGRVMKKGMHETCDTSFFIAPSLINGHDPNTSKKQGLWSIFTSYFVRLNSR